LVTFEKRVIFDGGDESVSNCEFFNHPLYGLPISEINYGSPAAGSVSTSFGQVNSTVNNLA
jgi:hypothetical protein